MSQNNHYSYHLERALLHHHSTKSPIVVIESGISMLVTGFLSGSFINAGCGAPDFLRVLGFVFITRL